MKNQQVSVNVPLMLQTALMYLGLALSVWVLLRLVQACFWLPGYLKKTSQDDENLGTPIPEDDYILDKKKNI